MRLTMRHRCARSLSAFAIAFLLGGQIRPSPARADPPPATTQSAPIVIDLAQAQIRAATGDATERLRQEILATPLARRVTVASQLDATGGLAGLDIVLQHGRPVADPRWIEGTCQVQMELRGGPVADLLLRQTSANPLRAPLPPEILQIRLRRWPELVFVAVGSATGGEAIESLRPAAVGPWAAVDPGACRRAIAAARADATQRELAALAALPASSLRLDLKAALAQPAARAGLIDLLNRQPVTRVEFLDDLRVAVTVVPVPQSLAAGVRRAIDSPQTGMAPLSPPAEAELTRLIADRPWSCVGTASAAEAGPRVPVASVLPAVAPPWVDHPLVDEAIAAAGAPPLRAERAAERAARARLRERFLALPLAEHDTVHDAVVADPRLLPAVDRALEQAQCIAVDYRGDGSVSVRVELDLRQAWDELTAASP